jgi:hypothetical protein
MEETQKVGLISKLMPGSELIVGNKYVRIRKKEECHVDGRNWTKLVWYENGLEIGLLIRDEAVSLWRQIHSHGIVSGSKTVVNTIGNKRFVLDDDEQQHQFLAKVIDFNGERRFSVEWWTFESSDGQELSVEVWDGAIYAYVSENISLSEIAIL